MFTFKTKNKTYNNCSIQTEGTGKYTKYEILDENKNAKARINLPGYGLSAETIAIDPYYNEPVMKFLTDNYLIKDYLGHLNSGHLNLEIVRLDIKKMKTL